MAADERFPVGLALQDFSVGVWPFILLFSWLLAEVGRRLWSLPRISTYAASGLFCSIFFPGLREQLGAESALLLANISFGLILFESGCRINIRWLIKNYWLPVACLAESLVIFSAIFMLCRFFDLSLTACLLIGALTTAVSPAVLVRVINEEKSSGQVTERALHLAAMSTLCAVFVFKIILGVVIYKTSGSFWDAVKGSVILFMASSFVGLAFGYALPAILNFFDIREGDFSVAYALGVSCCVILLDVSNLSPITGALMFGLVTRHRRIAPLFSPRGFGLLGDILSLFLFFYMAFILDFSRVTEGFWLAIAILLMRQVIKTLVAVFFARLSGVSARKAGLVGLATTPLSVFVILSLENTAKQGHALIDLALPLVAASLIMEIVGPFLVRLSLIMAKETARTMEA